MKRLLKSLVFLLAIFGSLVIFKDNSKAEKLEHDYNIFVEENKDLNYFTLKDKNENIIHDLPVYTKLDKNILEDNDGRDLESLWYIATNEEIIKYDLDKSDDFDENKENELPYLAQSKEKFEFKLKDEAKFIEESHESYEDYYRIIQKYELDGKEYELEYRILFDSYFQKKKYEELNKISPDLVLKFINRDLKKESTENNSIRKKESDNKNSIRKNVDKDQIIDDPAKIVVDDKVSGNNPDGGSSNPDNKLIYSGSLTNENGDPLANEYVLIKDQDGNEIKVKTDDDGYFSVKLDQNYSYDLYSKDYRGVLNTKVVDRFDFKSDNLSLNPGKVVNNKYGFVNFQASVAYLNKDFENYEVLKDYVLLDANKFNYSSGDIVVLPPVDGHKYGKVVKVKNVEKSDGLLKISYETPFFMETYRKVKMDTGDDGIDITEFSFVNNNNYIYKKKKKEPKISLYSAEERSASLEKMLHLNVVNEIRRTSDSDKYKDNKHKENNKQNKDFESKGVSYGGDFKVLFENDDESAFLGVGVDVGKNEKISFYDKNEQEISIEAKKFKDIEKYGDSLYKKIKEKAVNSESKIDTELSMQNEFDFQIYGNLGLNIDYDVDNLWDMKFDFRNNINVRTYDNVKFKGEFEYETEPQILQIYGPIFVEISFDFVADGEINGKVEYLSRNNSSFVLEGAPGNSHFKAFHVYPNFDGNSKKTSASAEGGITLTPALKVHPFIGVDKIAKIAAIPTLFGGEFETKYEKEIEAGQVNKKTIGTVSAIIRAENELEIEGEILKYLDKVGLESVSRIKIAGDKDILDIKQVLLDLNSPAKVVEDENGNKLLDIDLKLAPSGTNVEEGLEDSFQGKNPGLILKDTEDGVRLFVNPEIASKFKTDHHATYKRVPGWLNFFSNKTIVNYNFYINQENNYKDVVIKRHDLLADGSTIDINLPKDLIFKDKKKKPTEIELALKEAGMDNKVYNPNEDEANVSIGIYNMPDSLRSLKSNELFDLKADVKDLDIGEHEVYVLRKELRTGKTARKSMMNKKNDPFDPVESYGLDLDKDKLSSVDYYLDKFKVSIVDKQIAETKKEDELSANEENKDLPNVNYYSSVEEPVEKSEPVYIEDTINPENNSETEIEPITENIEETEPVIISEN